MSYHVGGWHRVADRWRGHAADRRARGAVRRWQHTGSEARWARSDLPARRALSRVFGTLFVLGAAVFAVLAALTGAPAHPDRPFYIGLAALCAAAAVVAALDLLIIRRRQAEQRRWGR